jgi:hypothetical protein
MNLIPTIAVVTTLVALVGCETSGADMTVLEPQMAAACRSEASNQFAVPREKHHDDRNGAIQRRLLHLRAMACREAAAGHIRLQV